MCSWDTGKGKSITDNTRSHSNSLHYLPSPVNTVTTQLDELGTFCSQDDQKVEIASKIMSPRKAPIRHKGSSDYGHGFIWKHFLGRTPMEKKKNSIVHFQFHCSHKKRNGSTFGVLKVSGNCAHTNFTNLLLISKVEPLPVPVTWAVSCFNSFINHHSDWRPLPWAIRRNSPCMQHLQKTQS